MVCIIANDNKAKYELTTVLLYKRTCIQTERKATDSFTFSSINSFSTSLLECRHAYINSNNKHQVSASSLTRLEYAGYFFEWSHVTCIWVNTEKKHRVSQYLTWHRLSWHVMTCHDLTLMSTVTWHKCLAWWQDMTCFQMICHMTCLSVFLSVCDGYNLKTLWLTNLKFCIVIGVGK